MSGKRGKPEQTKPIADAIRKLINGRTAPDASGSAQHQETSDAGALRATRPWVSDTLQACESTAMTIRDIIKSTIANVAAENQVKLTKLGDEAPLLETGLDSLCLAVIVARLEDELGVDPFDTDDEMVFPVTIGDFIRFYEHALA